MRNILVIGLGHFGVHLVQKLVEMGKEVMVVDKDENALSPVLDIVAQAQIGDCMDEIVLRSLGLEDFDVCFVCIGSDFQASLEITSQLKENGARFVVSKAVRELQKKFLLRNGADEVVFPEQDAAVRAAFRYGEDEIFDHFELTSDYSISEISTPNKWIGKTPREADVRTKWNINIIASKRGSVITPLTDPEYTFNSEEHLIVAGSNKAIWDVVNID